MRDACHWVGHVGVLLRFLRFRFGVEFCDCPAVEGTVVPKSQFARSYMVKEELVSPRHLDYFRGWECSPIKDGTPR